MRDTKKAWMALLASLILAGGALPASAQIEAGSQMVTGFAGGQLFDIGDQFTSSGTNFQTKVNLGARYQYNFTPHWGVEGSFLYSPGDTELLRGAFPDVSVDAYYYSANAVYNILPKQKIVPFVTAGIGAVNLDVSRGDTESFFTFNFGGGVLYPVARRFLVRFDVRDYVYSADGLGNDSLAALRLPANFDETIHDLSVNGGVSFIF